MSGTRHNAYFRRILVAYDGSPQSEKAVELAFSLAECVDSTVLVFAVARPPEPPTSVELKGYWTMRGSIMKRGSGKFWKRRAHVAWM